MGARNPQGKPRTNVIRLLVRESLYFISKSSVDQCRELSRLLCGQGHVVYRVRLKLVFMDVTHLQLSYHRRSYRSTVATGYFGLPNEHRWLAKPVQCTRRFRTASTLQ